MTVNFTPGESADLDVIAKAWDTTVAVVAWYLVSDYIQKARKRELHDLPLRESARDLVAELKKGDAQVYELGEEDGEGGEAEGDVWDGDSEEAEGEEPSERDPSEAWMVDL